MFFETRHCARMSSWRAQHIVTRSRQSRVGVLVGTAALFISSGCATVQQGLAELETLAAATSSTNGGTIVVGRTVEGSVRDSLVYHFDAAPGQELYGVIEGRGRNRYPQVQVEFYNTTRNARLVTARAYGGGEQGATRVFNPPEAGRFTVVIQNYHLNGRNTPVDDGTPFRFSLRTINRRPESIPPEVRAGQVVNGERIDDFHDIDEFTITARAGQTIQVALQGLGGRGAPEVELEVIAPVGDVRVLRVSSRGDAAALDTNTSRSVTLRDDGLYTVRVSGGYQPGRENPYRFRVDVR